MRVATIGWFLALIALVAIGVSEPGPSATAFVVEPAVSAPGDEITVRFVERTEAVGPLSFTFEVAAVGGWAPTHFLRRSGEDEPPSTQGWSPSTGIFESLSVALPGARSVLMVPEDAVEGAARICINQRVACASIHVRND